MNKEEAGETSLVARILSNDVAAAEAVADLIAIHGGRSGPPRPNKDDMASRGEIDIRRIIEGVASALDTASLSPDVAAVLVYGLGKAWRNGDAFQSLVRRLEHLDTGGGVEELEYQLVIAIENFLIRDSSGALDDDVVEALRRPKALSRLQELRTGGSTRTRRVAERLLSALE